MAASAAAREFVAESATAIRVENKSTNSMQIFIPELCFSGLQRFKKKRKERQVRLSSFYYAFISVIKAYRSGFSPVTSWPGA
jgi:hypothetical protein